MNIKNLDLNLLTVFNEIYEARSISAAAKQLDLSQPGMSHALKRLRTQLNDKLFVRKGNRIEPTTYAESISEPVRNALIFLEQGLTPDPDFDPKTSTWHFRLLMADFIEPIIVPDIMKLVFDNEKISFELISVQSTIVEDAILEGSVDLVVFLQTEMMNEISVEPLFPTEPVLAYRKGHPASKETEPLAAYSKYRKLSLNLRSGAVKNMDKVMFSQIGKRDYMGLVNSLRSIPALLVDSDCIAVIPKLYAQKVAPIYGLEYSPLPDNVMKQDITLSWHRKNDNDKALLWLRNGIKEIIEKQRADVM